MEVKIKEILSSVVLIHSNVLELKIDLDAIIGKEGRELDELVSKIFDELIVDVGNPGLELDWDVLEKEVNRLFLFQN